MDKSYSQTDERLSRYAVETFHPEDHILAEIRERSARNGLPEIQVGRMDVLHLEVLVRAIGARKAVEIGTLGGYSGVSIVRGLAPGGRLYTFDIEPKHAEVAHESFERAGLRDKVAIVIGPALQKLKTIEEEGPFDLVFIDADKENYPNYLKWAADNLRVGGVVLGDNTFGFGMIADDKFEPSERTSAEEFERMVKALRVFNKEIASGGRFRATILPTGEGLTMGVKIR